MCLYVRFAMCMDVSTSYESVRRLRVSLSYAVKCDYKEAPMCVLFFSNE